MIQKADLERMFTIDTENGRFFWKEAPRCHADLHGKEAGTAVVTRSKWYWRIKIGRMIYRRGSLMFLFIHGRLPFPMLDHKDGNSLNDRPSNLREADVFQNAQNYKKRARRIQLSMGVRLTKNGKYQARIGYMKSMRHLGTFDTPEQAREAYLAKRRELFGDFA